MTSSLVFCAPLSAQVSASSSRQSSSRRASCSSPSSTNRRAFRSNTKTASAFTNGRYGNTRYPKFTLRAADETPTTAEKDDEKEDIPPWERRELEKKAQQESGELPWPVFLLGSAITLVAATGSCFEWTFEKPIFGVVESTSGLYKPILGWFIVTGFPLSAYLWTKGIEGANKASELTDRLDGYD